MKKGRFAAVLRSALMERQRATRIWTPGRIFALRSLCRACARRVEWTSKWANINERCHYFSHRAEPRPAPVRPDEIFCGGVERIRTKVRRHRSNFINCQFKSASRTDSIALANIPRAGAGAREFSMHRTFRNRISPTFSDT